MVSEIQVREGRQAHHMHACMICPNAGDRIGHDI